MTAEHALRALLAPDDELRVESAGTEAVLQDMHPVVRALLEERGYDLSAHRQRKLTPEIAAPADIIVCFGRVHQQFVQENLGLGSRLFREMTSGRVEEIPDVWEVVPEWEQRPKESADYVRQVVGEICDTMPQLLARARQLVER